jgi:hypothetical protein
MAISINDLESLKYELQIVDLKTALTNSALQEELRKSLPNKLT